MRRTIAILATGALVGALMAPGVAPADPDGSDDAARRALSAGIQVAAKKPAGKAPTGVNPYLALLPDPANADYAGWRKWLTAQGEQRAVARAQLRALAPSPVLVDEEEPSGIRGSNDTPANAQRVSGFGTGSGSNPRARVLGTLSPEKVSAEEVPANAEDDGAIPLAGDTGVSADRRGAKTSATIGDGPHGSAGTGTGDFDFYKVTAAAGDTLTVDIDTPSGELDSIVQLYDATGTAVAANDDGDESLDSLLTYPVTTTGTYYVMVAGFLALPEDPNDPASGSGAQSEGPYDVTITTAKADTDFFAVKLRKGDVLGTSVTGAAALITIFDTVPREVHGSTQDPSFIYPANTPLPGGGNAVAEHVAEKAGWHYVGVGVGDGAYDITIEAYRPRLEGKKPIQTVFLDFDGARLNTAIFGGPGVRTLSPFRAFLGQWGLTAADENAVIDGIITRFRENVRQDLIASGLNENFAVRILNSRDHADPFGDANVSRVIVGGTQGESGIATIGISQSIDPGNFDTEDSALVLLDALSAPAGADESLNTYLGAGSNRLRFVSQVVGNISAHEAGHFWGNWHVDQFNEQPNLMDQGGNFPVMFGVGPDGLGGTADDVDVDFGEDTLNPAEGFTGIEDTLSRIALVVTK